MVDKLDLTQELQKLQDFLREPDHADHFGKSELIDWLNRRPTHILPRAIAAILSTSTEDARERVKVLEEAARLLLASVVELLEPLERASAPARQWSSRAWRSMSMERLRSIAPVLPLTSPAPPSAIRRRIVMGESIAEVAA